MFYLFFASPYLEQDPRCYKTFKESFRTLFLVRYTSLIFMNKFDTVLSMEIQKK